MIRGHKHLHECAFIGDDSSEELEELLEVAKETGFLTMNGSLEVIFIYYISTMLSGCKTKTI